MDGQRTVFTSYVSPDDAVNQARRAGYKPIGSTTRMQGGQTIYIVFARQGFGQRVNNMDKFIQGKIW